jgi:polyferredoxin
MSSNKLKEELRTTPLIVTFLLTFVLLAIVQVVVDTPMMIAERFVPGAGWIEALMLASYASWLLRRLHDRRGTAIWRRRLWTFFSVVFFAQLSIGLLGAERFLMSGELHLPIPAMIIAGPLYRGNGLFMPILFFATVLLVGPAWCSYLCYIGSWDLNSAVARKRPRPLKVNRLWIRSGIVVGVVGVALALRWFGVNGTVATLLGLAFGVVGVGVMVVASRRVGVMVHCTMYCPIGLAADVLGKLSPFRLRITDGCTDCGACTLKCRYDALRPEDIDARRPGLTCTLCGDCLSSCKGRSIEYRFGGLAPRTARIVFLVLVVSLHAVFLGVARI